MKTYLAKNTSDSKSLFDMIKDAIAEKDLAKVSSLQLEMNSKMDQISAMYREYCNNQI